MIYILTSYFRRNVTSEEGNALFTPNTQNSNEGAFFGTETNDVVGEPPPHPISNSPKNLGNHDDQAGNSQFLYNAYISYIHINEIMFLCESKLN